MEIQLASQTPSTRLRYATKFNRLKHTSISATITAELKGRIFRYPIVLEFYFLNSWLRDR